MEQKIDRFRGKYRFLSNFFEAFVKASDGTEFPTVEQAYQYDKFSESWPTHKAVREKLKAARSPGEAKRIAGANKDLVPAEFHNNKLHIMRRLLEQKFRFGSKLARQLMDTGDADLIEGNQWGDIFWGVCRGKGENHLGRLLMEIRNELLGR